MRNARHVLVAAVAGFNLLLVSDSLGQGSLTPPGPPAPTMKTLDQVEPRISIDAAHTPGDSNNTFIISQPGSYYLAGNIHITNGLNGISVQANEVTIDLNGFTLTGPGQNASGGSAIVAAVGNDVRVRNGYIDGWPKDAISLGAVAVVENVDIQYCGGYGIHAGEQTHVSHCRVGAVLQGIAVLDSSVIDSCIVIAGGVNNILAGKNCLITHNTSNYAVSGPLASGIIVGASSVVRDNVCNFNAVYGIYPGTSSVVRDNVCNKNKEGIFSDYVGVWIEGNVAEQNVYGIHVMDDSAVVIHNVAGKNSLSDYLKPAGSPNFGAIQSPSSMTNPAANIQL